MKTKERLVNELTTLARNLYGDSETLDIVKQEWYSQPIGELYFILQVWRDVNEKFNRMGFRRVN